MLRCVSITPFGSPVRARGVDDRREIDVDAATRGGAWSGADAAFIASSHARVPGSFAELVLRLVQGSPETITLFRCERLRMAASHEDRRDRCASVIRAVARQSFSR